MAQSLQDQLLKAGLVTEKQVKDSRRKDKGARKAKKPPKNARPPQAKSVVPTAEQAASPATEREREIARQRAAKVARDRALNQDRQADRERKARRAQARQLIEQQSRNDAAADLPYNFQRGKKIKRLYVTGDQREALLAGRLAVLGIEGTAHVMTPEAAERVLALAPDAWVHRHDPAAEPVAESGAEDDPYADYKVPDDLMW